MTRQADTSSFSPFRELADSPEPAWLWDSEQGTILWANKRALEFWGQSSLKELLALKLDHAMPGLRALKKIGRTELPEDGITDKFLFWTRAGVQNVSCRVRRLGFQDGLNGLLISLPSLPMETKGWPETKFDAQSEQAQSETDSTYSNQTTVKSSATAGRSAEPSTIGSDDRTALAQIAGMIRKGGEGPQYAANQNLAQNGSGVKRGEEQDGPDDDQVVSSQTEFLAKVSHEVRTPLNSIIGFAELISEERFGPIDNPKYKGYINDIRTSAEHALSLVNELLDISKIQSGEFELDPTVVDVNAVIEQCVRAMQPQSQKARTLVRTSFLPDRPHVTADQRSVKQILLNLLSNSIKFTEPGGQVVVSTQRDEGGNLTIRVQDTGVGMSPEEVLIALKPFQQLDRTHRKHSGTGLGLPLAKALAEANKALFNLESESNKGTRVDITFPKDLCV